MVSAGELSKYRDSRKKNEEPGLFMVKVWVLGILLLAVAGWCFTISHTIHILRLNGSVATWPVVNGRIIQSVRNVTSVNTGKNSSNPKTRYFPDVTYSYSVNGREYTSRQLFIDTLFPYLLSPDKESADAIVKAYPRGKEVEVRYLPSDESYSVLQTKKAVWWFYIPMGFAILAAALSNFLFFARGGLMGTYYKNMLPERLKQ